MRVAFYACIYCLFASTWPGTEPGRFRIVSGKELDSALPRDFYLEGNAIPTEKRNAVLLRTPSGARLMFSLLDTSGYSSQVRQKYVGMIIAEGPVSICGNPIRVGSFGFGLDRPGAGGSEPAIFHLYDQAGAGVGNCTANKDSGLAQPKPLQAVVDDRGHGRLYLGRYWLELR
jgi:hypothetical protein